MTTKIPPSAMKATHWSMTYWLTDGRTREGFDALVQNMPADWHIEGQIEQGKDSQDKLHCQLYLKTPQTRGTRIAKFFPSAWFEPAKNRFAAQQYPHKEDTRVEELKTVENRSPQWHIVRDRFYQWYVDEHSHELGLRVDDEEKLKYWDHFIGLSLEEGMSVDVIGVNPQYRSCIMRYWTYMIRRTLAARQNISVDKCLDKDKTKVAPGSGNAELQGAAELPRCVKKTVKVFLPKE